MNLKHISRIKSIKPELQFCESGINRKRAIDFTGIIDNHDPCNSEIVPINKVLNRITFRFNYYGKLLCCFICCSQFCYLHHHVDWLHVFLCPQVSAQQSEMDGKFAAMHRTVVLLKKYGQKLPEQTSQLFNAAPSRWNNLKTKVSLAKQRLGPRIQEESVRITQVCGRLCFNCLE